MNYIYLYCTRGAARTKRRDAFHLNEACNERTQISEYAAGPQGFCVCEKDSFFSRFPIQAVRIENAQKGYICCVGLWKKAEGGVLAVLRTVKRILAVQLAY